MELFDMMFDAFGLATSYFAPSRTCTFYMPSIAVPNFRWSRCRTTRQRVRSTYIPIKIIEMALERVQVVTSTVDDFDYRNTITQDYKRFTHQCYISH